MTNIALSLQQFQEARQNIHREHNWAISIISTNSHILIMSRTMPCLRFLSIYSVNLQTFDLEVAKDNAKDKVIELTVGLYVWDLLIS